MVLLEAIASSSDFDIGPVSALSNSRRRQFIFALINQHPIDSDDLASKRLFHDGDTVAELQDELTQTHLPLLDEAGFIEWDRETGMVSKGPRFDEIQALLDSMGHVGERG